MHKARSTFYHFIEGTRSCHIRHFDKLEFASAVLGVEDWLEPFSFLDVANGATNTIANCKQLVDYIGTDVAIRALYVLVT
jgi:hypothetical protein